MLAAILALLCGTVLGQRFKMLVLAPASLFALILGIIIGIAHAETLMRVGLNAAALIACVQMGYLLGLGLRHLTVIARARRMRTATWENSLPARRSAH
jgi:hypothetical protein